VCLLQLLGYFCVYKISKYESQCFHIFVILLTTIVFSQHPKFKFSYMLQHNSVNTIYFEGQRTDPLSKKIKGQLI
jgi:hypothetical protein